MKERRVVVIGAGIGGLTAAIALRRIGIDVAVFERAPELHEVGAGITLWPNATRILLDLGLDELVSRGRRFTEGALRSPSGTLLAKNQVRSLETHFDAPAIAIHRAELHAALVAALPEGSIQLAAECVAIDTTGANPIVTFANGFTATGDLVIGADGIRSMVRSIIVPHIAPRYAGYTVWRGISEEATSEVVETWGRGARFGIVPLRDRTYWFAVVNSEEGRVRSREEGRRQLLSLFGHWHQPIERLITSTHVLQIISGDIYDLAPFQPWSRDSIVLLGDSAHATTPNLGQGACMAIESAAILAEELGRASNVRAAVEAYEARRMKRTAAITNESWKIGRIGQLENGLAASLRDFLMRRMPSAVGERQIFRLVAGKE